MKFKRTTALNKILALKKRIKVIQGGTSAGKTIAILGILIDMATKIPGIEISVVGSTFPQLRRGALKDFKSIMNTTGRWRGDNWNVSDRKYTFSNNAYIEFFSVEDEEKIRGARRHVLFINEANRIRFDTYHQLKIRTSREIFIDFNPSHRFWVHDEVVPEDEAGQMILTFKDNEARPENVDADMADAKRKHDLNVSPYWVNYWRVFGLGEIGMLQGVVWSDWSVINDLPRDDDGNVTAELLGYGCDFGYSISYTAVIAVYRYQGEYIFDEVIYEKKLSNKDIAQMIKMSGYMNDLVYCDSAEPKSIDELRRNGINAHPCASKSDIRSYAIDKIGSQHFQVTKRSEGIITDLENYQWQEDKTGKQLPKPKKDFDHAPDAMIYFIGTEDKYDGRY